MKILVSAKTLIEGQKLSFVNDLTVTQDGRKIYFTDSSSKWQRRDYLFLIMEGTDDGRQVSLPRRNGLHHFFGHEVVSLYKAPVQTLHCPGESERMCGCF